MESKKNGTLGWLGNSADGVAVIDADYRILLWNKAAEEITSFSQEEAQGEKCYDVFMGRDINSNAVCRKDCWDMVLAKRGEIVPSKEILSRTKIGKGACLSVTSINMPGTEENSPLLVHVFRDATLKRNTERVMGQILTLVDELARSREQKRPQGEEASSAATPPLSHREVEILGMLTEGANVKTIADSLLISPATARKHVQNILSKLMVHSQVQAIAYATRHGLVRKSA